MRSPIARSPIALWAGFVIAHLWLGFLALYAPGQPIGDVTSVYRFWIEHAFSRGQWVGIDTVWVYPIGALVPMLASYAFGGDLYASTWLSLTMLADAAAFAVIVHVSRRAGAVHLSWWWIAFLVALGPVAVGRIDTFTVAAALIGMLLLHSRPALAGILLAIATWIKVWPAALLAAAVLALRERAQVAAGAVATSAVVVILALALGAGGNVFSFIAQQTGRGLQIESVVATPWMWDAGRGPGHTEVYYDYSILTFQVRGPGVDAAAAATTGLLVLAVLGLLLLGAVALRRGRLPAEVLGPLSLASTASLIVFNKVGSPQFVTWLAVPVVFGLVTAARGAGVSFRVPAVLALLVAVLTQGFYPYLYHLLLGGELAMVAVLSVRNLLYVALLAWAVAALVRVIRSPVAADRYSPEPPDSSWSRIPS